MAADLIALYWAAACAMLFLLLQVFEWGARGRRGGAAPLPPGSRGLPVVGETADFLRCMRENRPQDFVKTRRRKYGEGASVFWTSLFLERMVVMGGPDATRFLLCSEGKLVRDTLPNSVLSVLGRSSVVAQASGGAQHRRLRRLLMGGLCPQALRGCVQRVDLLTRRHFQERWPAAGARVGSLYELVKAHALGVATELFMGEGCEAAGVQNSELDGLFRTLFAGLLTIPLYLPGTRYYKARRARARLGALLQCVVERRMAALVSSTAPDDLLSAILLATDERGRPLTPDETIDNLITLIFSGHDTNTSTLSLACRFLANNPACYQRLRQEHQEIARAKGPGNDTLTWEDLQKMKYTWCVVQETLRLEPTTHWSCKVSIADFEYGGFRIPQGWKIMHNLCETNLDEKYFPEPLQFDPSRFMADSSTSVAPYVFSPFGGGAHMCQGIDFAKMFILVFFHHLTMNYDWEMENPNERVRRDPMPVPANGFPLIVTPRSSKA